VGEGEGEDVKDLTLPLPLPSREGDKKGFFLRSHKNKFKEKR
jgi:hypothetical protein